MRAKEDMMEEFEASVSFTETDDSRMVDGGRNNRWHHLEEYEQEMILREADIIGIPVYDNPDLVVFNSHASTAYHDDPDIISVAGDIYPDLSSTHPTDRLTIRAVLAHEWYGHRACRGTLLPKGHPLDEARASYLAATTCPNLTNEEKQQLVEDAKERLNRVEMYRNICLEDILELCKKEESDYE